MSKKVYLTEEQFNWLIENSVSHEVLTEGRVMDILNWLKNVVNSPDEAIAWIKQHAKEGAISISLALALIGAVEVPHAVKYRAQQEIQQMQTEKPMNNLGMNQNTQPANKIDQNNQVNLADTAALQPVRPKNTDNKTWKMLSNNFIITVYNAKPSQCNKDVMHTASMFTLDLEHPEKHRIVAMERTAMAKYGIKYGDIIKIVGTYKGLQDGVYQVQDTMNKRFAGQEKVDVLVDNNTKTGGTLKDQNAEVYLLTDKTKYDEYKSQMAPQYQPKKTPKK